MSGWVKIHRGLLDWEWYEDKNVKIVWLHLLLTVNYKGTKYKGHDIPRGSGVYGYPALAKQTSLSIQNVRTAISKLKSTGELTVKVTPKFSIISIAKFDEYQVDNSQDNSQLTGNQQSTNSQLTTSKEGKKERREDNNVDESTFDVFWEKFFRLLDNPTLKSRNRKSEIKKFYGKCQKQKVSDEILLSFYESEIELARGEQREAGGIHRNKTPEDILDWNKSNNSSKDDDPVVKINKATAERARQEYSGNFTLTDSTLRFVIGESKPRVLNFDDENFNNILKGYKLELQTA